MHQALAVLHVVFAVFIAGPLVGAAMLAPRLVRTGDAGALQAAARTVRIYGWASLLIFIFGGAMVHSFGPLWIWLSTLLYAATLALAVGVLHPSLDRSARLVSAGDDPGPLAGRVAASGGLIALLLLAIVVLMVLKPG